jgi:hypothetical protein
MNDEGRMKNATSGRTSVVALWSRYIIGGTLLAPAYTAGQAGFKALECLPTG